MKQAKICWDYPNTKSVLCKIGFEPIGLSVNAMANELRNQWRLGAQRTPNYLSPNATLTGPEPQNRDVRAQDRRAAWGPVKQHVGQTDYPSKTDYPIEPSLPVLPHFTGLCLAPLPITQMCPADIGLCGYTGQR